MYDGRYVSVPEFKRWVRNEMQSVDDEVIGDALAAAELTLDNACGRRFSVASTEPGDATTRLFAPDGYSHRVDIDDCTTVVSVTNDGTTVAADRYQLEPLNGLSPAGEAVPYTTIRRIGSRWSWAQSEALVAVTALWGWLEIPAQVVEACKVLTKAHLDGRNIQLGIAGLTADGSALSEQHARVVRQAIYDYGRRAVLMA